MFMEPLDPDGTLTLLDRQRYYDDLLAVLGERASLDVDRRTAAVARGLGDYLRAQAALSDPRSDEQFWQAVHDHGQQVGTARCSAWAPEPGVLDRCFDAPPDGGIRVDHVLQGRHRNRAADRDRQAREHLAAGGTDAGRADQHAPIGVDDDL